VTILNAAREPTQPIRVRRHAAPLDAIALLIKQE